MADEDYYSILGVSKDATQDEINTAYRTLAKKWHPDVNKSPNATEMFEKITNAYQVLKDPKKRAAYDRFGQAGVDGADGGVAGFNPGNFTADDFGDVNDIFSQFFRGGSRSRQRRPDGPIRGKDVLMRMKITFMDACKGREVDMPYKYDGPCPACDGKGAVNPSDVSTCPQCGGTGFVVSVQNTMFGRFQSQTTCPRCSGRGTVITNPCSQCGGSGTVTINDTLHISIPAGIEEGQRLRVPNRGGRGLNGGPNGDLYIEMVVEDDKDFQRDGLDILTDNRVPLITAVLGGQIEVDTIWGPQTVDVKAGTQPGAKIKVKGMGIKKANGLTGNHIVTVEIKIPTRLNQEEKDLYQKLGEIAEKKGEAKGLFSKIFGKKK